MSATHNPSSSQREAIEADLEPTLVLAGPGAGKTFCLIERIRFLIDRLGINPARICAVTFTNKAAEEIGHRLKKEMGDAAEAVRRSTIHSLSVSLLREFGSVLGIERGFGIADEEYQKEILSWCRVQPGRRSSLLGLFSLHRLMEYPLAEDDARRFAFYRRQLAKRGMLDFEDLVLKTAELLREHPSVAEQVRGRWSYLLVDEFQDLNHVQYEIIRHLARDHRAVFAVGDDDQSIFSWTGADPRIITRFLNDFAVKRKIVLQENHRSARQIFELARRFVAQNPTFFEKPLVATRETLHPVEAHSFDGDDAEEAWLLGEIRRDRAANGLGWGDVAILYRKHQIGEGLEGRLMQEGIPCRLAQGRSVSDDQVVRYLIAALHLVVSPRDPFYVSLFARRVLPADLLDRLRTETVRNRMGLLQTMQRESRRRPRADEDGRKIRRALAAMNNLPALASRHRELSGLIDELLSHRIHTYRTLLEQRADELSDPLDWPAVRALAEQLRLVQAERRRVLIPPMGGVEIGLAGMLTGAGLPLVDYQTAAAGAAPGDFVLQPGVGGALGIALGTFKALQLLDARAEGRFADCVIFDLETTGLDRAQAEIVEIAAVRLRGWEVVDEFHTLVRPRVAIEAGAERTHGFSEADVAGAPYFETVWPAFRDFIGSDVLVAHNGYEYDLPILARMVTAAGAPFSVIPFDTLQLARTLFPRSARLEHLAERFGIDSGRAHHATDDVRTLARVFRRLEEEKVARARRVGLSQLLDYLAVSLALSDPTALDPEGVMLKDATRIYPLNRFSNALEFYRGERDRVGPSAATVDDLIDRLGGRGLMDRVRAEKRAEDRYPNAMSRIRRLMAGLPDEGLEPQIQEFLARLALSRSDGVDADPDRVNLLTLHATKGLEFSRVYLVGMEDGQMLAANGKAGAEDEVEEARRLVYVGMTRAKDRLVMTRVGLRRQRPTGGHRFLDEMGFCPTKR